MRAEPGLYELRAWVLMVYHVGGESGGGWIGGESRRSAVVKCVRHIGMTGQEACPTRRKLALQNQRAAAPILGVLPRMPSGRLFSLASLICSGVRTSGSDSFTCSFSRET